VPHERVVGEAFHANTLQRKAPLRDEDLERPNRLVAHEAVLLGLDIFEEILRGAPRSEPPDRLGNVDAEAAWSLGVLQRPPGCLQPVVPEGDERGPDRLAALARREQIHQARHEAWIALAGCRAREKLRVLG
jgi:hypothetical protein